MRINHNIAAMNTYNKLTANTAATSKSLEKLSSGLKINRAGDNAAGLAISEKMRAQVRGLDQANTNAQDGVSLIQTAEGALNETHSILQRMRELAVQSSTDTNTADDRSKIQSEVDELAKEITRIANTTEFNTKNLVAGGLSSTFHIGANANQSISLSIGAMDAFSLGVAGTTTAVSGGTWGGATVHKITGVESPGRGLEAGTDYTVVATKTAATASVAPTRSGGTGTETTNVLTITAATGFTGTTTTAYTVKVGSVSADADGNNVTSFLVSKDGGSTWSNVAATNALGSSTATIDGVNVSIADADGARRFAVGDTYSYTMEPASATLKLQKGGADVGGTTTVYYGSSSAVVGDVGNSKSLEVNFDFSTLTAGTTAAFTVSASSSSAATVVNDVVTVAADTKAGLDVSTQSAANSAITTIDNAIKQVSSERSKLGSYQNRLEHTSNNLSTSSENLSAAESRVRDVDMAKEMMEFQKNNILNQASTAMLAQANQQPQGVLQLLQ